MRYENLFPSKYLKGADFAEGDRTLTIKDVVVDDIVTVQGKEKKPLIYFEEVTDKSLVLNKTNARTIAAMYGPETTGWLGKAVTLTMAQTAAAGGEMVDCVRVRKGIPAPQKGGKK